TDRNTKCLSKGNSTDDVSDSKEELRRMVDIADTEGTFNEAESNRNKGVPDFYNLDIKDVLKTPRVDIIALPSDASFAEVREVAIQNAFSRYPVYDKDIDNIVAVFH